MIPIEWVCRRIATRSFLKRNPSVKEGYKFYPPKVETFFKDDANNDPQWSEEQLIAAKFCFAGLIMSQTEVDIISHATQAIFEILEKSWLPQNCTLVDMKIEFGVDVTTKEIVLADVIDNDSWRLWPSGDQSQQKDKQSYRDLKEVTPEGLQMVKNFEWVADRMELLLKSDSQCRVVVLMGSTSELGHCEKIKKACGNFGIPCELQVTSAHKGPDEILRIKAEYEGDGIPTVFVAVAGRSNGLGLVMSERHLTIRFSEVLLVLSFTGKTTEEPAKPPCTDENEGEDCLFASAKMNKPKDQEKVLLRLVNMDMPVRPGILVQRQSKDGEVASPLGEITEAEEDKHRQTLEPLTNAGETTLEVTTERDATVWSKGKLRELLVGIAMENETGRCEISELKQVEGEASCSSRKGKLIFFYEWNIKLAWKGTIKESGAKHKGLIEIPSLSEENEVDDTEVNVSKKKGDGDILKDLMKTTGTAKVREALGEYLKALKTEFTTGMILPTKAIATQELTVERKVTGNPLQVQASPVALGVRIPTVALHLTELFDTTVEQLYSIFTVKDKLKREGNSKCLMGTSLENMWNC
ncbi:hypothetical protein NN561_005205 [Cricetulus griseus]